MPLAIYPFKGLAVCASWHVKLSEINGRAVIVFFVFLFFFFFFCLSSRSTDNDDATKRKVNLVFEKIQTLKSRAAGSTQGNNQVSQSSAFSTRHFTWTMANCFPWLRLVTAVSGKFPE